MQTGTCATIAVLALLACGATAPTDAPRKLTLRQYDELVESERSQIQYDFESAIARAGDSLATEDFAEADAEREKASAAAAQNPGVFSGSEQNEWKSRLAELHRRIDQTRMAAMSTPDGVRRIEAAKRRTLIDNFQVSRLGCQRTIGDLVKKARQCIDDAQYNEAKGVLEQILILEPQNRYAIGMTPLLADRTVRFERRFDPESLLASTPDWLLIPLAAALPFVLSRLHARARSRASRGLCVKCGYDLRATPQRCPECGTVPMSGA